MNYEPISTTAHTIAFVRPSARIPYASDISAASGAEAATRHFYHRDDFDVDLTRMVELAPYIRLRFLARQRIARGTGIPMVVELASGLSPAGMIESQQHVWKYLETDLPEMIALKKRIVHEVTGGAMPKKLQFAAVNALDHPRLREAVLDFNPDGPVIISCEGLLQYLTHEEKRELAKSIRAILADHGGMWLTTDVALKRVFAAGFDKDDYTRRLRMIMAENTGRDMVDLAFDSLDEAEKLFRECGLSVKVRRQIDAAPDAIRPEVLAWHRGLNDQYIFAMTS